MNIVFYEKIVILGRDQSKAFNHVIAEIFRKDLHNDPSYFILGNGESDVDISQLSLIKNRVNSDTIVHIYAHGNIDDTGKHSLDLGEFNNIYTKTLLSELAYYMSSYPIFAHVHSCFGGAAVDNVVIFPVGSVILAHGPADDISFSDAYEVSLLEDFRHFPELVGSNLMKEFLQSINVGIKLNDYKNKLFSMKLAPEIVFGTNLVEYVKDQWGKFYEELSHLKETALLPTNIKLDDKEIDVSFDSKELKTFQEHYFKLQCISNSDEIKDFLKSNSQKVKYLLDRTLSNGKVLKNPEITKALLEAGADANARDKHDVSLIILAANQKYTESAKVLLEYGASINEDATLETLVRAFYHEREFVKKLVFPAVDILNESILTKLLQNITSIQEELDAKYSNYYGYRSFYAKHAEYFVSGCDMEYFQEIFMKLHDSNNEASLNIFLDYYFHFCDKKYCSSDLRDTVRNKIVENNNKNLIEKYIDNTIATNNSFELSKVLELCLKNDKNWLLYGLKEVDGKTPYMEPMLKSLAYLKLLTESVVKEYLKKGAIEIFNTFSLSTFQHGVSIDVVKILFQNGLDLNSVQIPKECPSDTSLTFVTFNLDNVNLEFVELLLQNCISPQEPVMCGRRFFDHGDSNNDKALELQAMIDHYAANPPEYCEGNFI